MELRSSYSRGFTLIEILVTLGILTSILAVSLNVGFDTYNRADFYAERDLVVGYLQSARGRAIANIRNVSHGIEVRSADDEYEVREDTDVVLTIPAREGVEVSGSDGGDVLITFRQNSGRSSGGEIVIDDGVRTGVITVTQEGAILWE